jgi:hypothetical protein
VGARLNQHPATVCSLLPVALLALKLDDFANVLEGQAERRASMTKRRWPAHTWWEEQKMDTGPGVA